MLFIRRLDRLHRAQGNSGSPGVGIGTRVNALVTSFALHAHAKICSPAGAHGLAILMAAGSVAGIVVCFVGPAEVQYGTGSLATILGVGAAIIISAMRVAAQSARFMDRLADKMMLMAAAGASTAIDGKFGVGSPWRNALINDAVASMHEWDELSMSAMQTQLGEVMRQVSRLQYEIDELRSR